MGYGWKDAEFSNCGVVKDYMYGNMYGSPDPVVFFCLPDYANILRGGYPQGIGGEYGRYYDLIVQRLFETGRYCSSAGISAGMVCYEYVAAAVFIQGGYTLVGLCAGGGDGHDYLFFYH